LTKPDAVAAATAPGPLVAGVAVGGATGVTPKALGAGVWAPKAGAFPKAGAAGACGCGCASAVGVCWAGKGDAAGGVVAVGATASDTFLSSTAPGASAPPLTGSSTFAPNAADAVAAGKAGGGAIAASPPNDDPPDAAAAPPNADLPKAGAAGGDAGAGKAAFTAVAPSLTGATGCLSSTGFAAAAGEPPNAGVSVAGAVKAGGGGVGALPNGVGAGD
jgi:hypothetical protein